MKKALLFGATLALICGAGLVGVSIAEQDNGPEVVKMTDGTDASKNPAYFPHRDHQDRLKDCGICHHGKKDDGTQAPYAEAQEPKSRKCHTCHNATGVTLDGKVPGISPIQRAGHGRCQGCHKDQKSTKTPPTQLMACPTCHSMYKDKVK